MSIERRVNNVMKELNNPRGIVFYLLLLKDKFNYGFLRDVVNDISGEYYIDITRDTILYDLRTEEFNLEEYEKNNFYFA